MRNIGNTEGQEETPDGRPIHEERAQLVSLLLDIGRQRSLRDPLATVCEELQLTAPQIHVLFWLGHDASLTMGELARRLGISEKTATGVVDRLENAGHVLRERDPEDRRLVRVRLAEGGATFFAQIDAHLKEVLTLILTLLDPQQRQNLLDIIDSLHTRMKQHAMAEAPAIGESP